MKKLYLIVCLILLTLISVYFFIGCGGSSTPDYVGEWSYVYSMGPPPIYNLREDGGYSLLTYNGVPHSSDITSGEMGTYTVASDQITFNVTHQYNGVTWTAAPATNGPFSFSVIREVSITIDSNLYNYYGPATALPVP